MLAVLINVATVLIGSSLGLLFGSRIKENYTQGIMMGIALCTFVIGVQSAIQTSNILIVMICLVIGTVIGVWLKLDDRMNGASDRIKERLKGTKLGNGPGNGPFAEAFMTTTMLFCVGTMTVIGSIEAGLNHNYEILIAKSIMDLMSSLIFAAALGAGVMLSAVSVLVIQGGIALLASVAAPVLTTEVVTEMSAVGGTLFIGMAINLLGVSQKHIKIGDMLPGIFLPILYFPLKALLSNLL